MIDDATAYRVIAEALIEDDLTLWPLDRLDELCIFVAVQNGWELEEIGLQEDAVHGVNLPEEMDV